MRATSNDKQCVIFPPTISYDIDIEYMLAWSYLSLLFDFIEYIETNRDYVQTAAINTNTF